MLKRLRSLFVPTSSPGEVVAGTSSLQAPLHISSPGVPDFDLDAHLVDANGLAVLDWAAAQQWVDRIDDAEAKAAAWTACELAWLEHLRAGLGAGYQTRLLGNAVLLSSLEPKIAEATLAFMGKTLQRVVRVLAGVARDSEWGKDILVIFDDDETYYRYVAHYYPEAGEFAGSGGMYVDQGCGHFVTVKAELHAIEPVITHELTHACLGHLPIPAWLNEGLAVNTERRLCPPPSAAFGGRSTPQQMHARHQKFWGADEIQEFWSGKSFLRSDEGNELSYDLARIMVAQFAADWDRFRPFVLAAQLADAGAAAARQHLGLELGDAVQALLEAAPSPAWAPNPERWAGTPERGAFRLRP